MSAVLSPVSSELATVSRTIDGIGCEYLSTTMNVLSRGLPDINMYRSFSQSAQMLMYMVHSTSSMVSERLVSNLTPSTASPRTST